VPEQGSQEADNAHRTVKPADRTAELVASNAFAAGSATGGRTTPGPPMRVLNSYGRGNGLARAAAILALQQTHGNSAVQRLLQRTTPTSAIHTVQRMPADPGGGAGSLPQQGPVRPAPPATDPYVRQHNLQLVTESDVKRVMVGAKLRYSVDGDILINIPARHDAYPRIVRWTVPNFANGSRQTQDPDANGYSPEIEFKRAGQYRITAEVQVSPASSVMVDLIQDVSDPDAVLNLSNADHQAALKDAPTSYADFHQQITDHTTTLTQDASLNTDHAAQKYGYAYIEAAGQNPLVIQQSLWHDATGYGSSTFTAHPAQGKQPALYRWHVLPAQAPHLPSATGPNNSTPDIYIGAQPDSAGGNTLALPEPGEAQALQGHRAYRLHNTGPTISWEWHLADAPNSFVFVCDQLDSQGRLLGTAVYRQVVQNADQAYRLDHWKEYIQRVEDKSKEIPQGLEVAVQAVYLNKQTGETTPLNLFIGHTRGTPPGRSVPQPTPAGNGPQPVPSPTELTPPPPGVAANNSSVVLLDLTPGAAPAHYQGDTAASALHEFEHNNSYPEGWIELRIPSTVEVIKNKKIMPTASLPGAQAGAVRIATKGSSDLGQGVEPTSWLGLGIAGGGAIALALTGPGFITAAFFYVAAGFGITSATLNEIDNWQRGTLEPEIVAIDLLAIVSSMLGGTGGEVTANVLGKFTAERIMVTTVGRWAVYTGYAAGAVDGVLIALHSLKSIQELLSDPDMPRNQKVDALGKILLNLALTGGLIAFGAKSLAEPRKMVAEIIGGKAAQLLTVNEVRNLQFLSAEAWESIREGRPTPKQLKTLVPVIQHILSLANAADHLARLNKLLEEHGVGVLEALEKRPGGRVPYLEDYFRKKTKP